MNTGRPPYRMLVAEDDVVFALLLQYHLEHAGFVVTIAEDGQQAWERLQTTDFDALVADVQMPVLNGIELTRKIRTGPRCATMPIVLVTAKAFEFDVPRIEQELSISHVFIKPSAPDTIVRAVRECLKHLKRE